jgi:hypothetical protein
MITKKVNRYYCEYCKKAGCSAGHIRSHERHCTLNPNRECRMCDILQNGKPNLNYLIGFLPHIEDYKKIAVDSYDFLDYETITYGNLGAELDKILPILRKQSGNCPCCILAAIRQSKIPVYLVKDFNFKEECQEVFRMKNEDRDISYC